ncbi:DUF502 domain-containing protein [Halorientalis brevis]|uniref:DUF502 domain-containing protein n=1 Tax=Halorientalis brevis TaxID=1126241 RepID=A0ABD6CH71_9EURY|nr:DUF502 domain-containing protein [Halorientalis brevis]
MQGATTKSGSNGEALKERARSAMVTGLAVTVPLIVTLIVLGFAVDFVSGTLNPLVAVVESTLSTSGVPELAVKGVVLLVLLVVILVVGLVADRQPQEGSIEDNFDRMMAGIPGIGSLYTSFNEMSQLLLDSDTDSFQEVKLVEFPSEGSYTVAFLTADTPETIEDATGHDEMVTLFLPLAPNPVMGGHVISVDEDRVTDVDMTVSEGIRAIVTSGVAIEDNGEEVPDELASATNRKNTEKGTGDESPTE